MIFPGHVAAAGLAARLLKAEPRAALAASMFPDLVDKPVRWLFRRTPNDRIPAHTFLGWALTTALAALLFGRVAARGWCVGYAAHLACDEVNAHLNPGRIYFWWPIKHYQMHTGPTGLRSSLADFTPASLAVEATITVVGALAWLSRRQTVEGVGQRPGR